MVFINQIDCFNSNIKFWKFLGIWPEHAWPYYNYYSRIFVLIFVFVYDYLPVINLYFLPTQLDTFIGEMLFCCTVISVSSKVLTFLLMHDEIQKILVTLQSHIFEPVSDIEIAIIEAAKKFNTRYWKIVAVVSNASNLMYFVPPIISHFLFSTKLELTMCSYSFLSDDFKDTHIYPLYIYQSLGMYIAMWYNVNIDTFFLGLMIFVIAQLDILDKRLRTITESLKLTPKPEQRIHNVIHEKDYTNLKKAVIHFDEVGKFCSLVQRVFSVTLFVQFSMASVIICVCLIRFTLPFPSINYYISVVMYTFVMIIQILVPCWFGTRIIDKSSQLSMAIYASDWTSCSQKFKSSLLLFAERTKRPLSIIGWKMFPLSLTTFTSIMNLAYSFFTLLRHMQSRQK